MLINKVLWYSIFIPLVVGAIYFRRLNLSHKYLYGFVITGVLTEVISRIMKNILEVKNNMPLGHSYISVSFIFIAIFYLYELKGFINQKIIMWIIIVFELFSILNVIYFQSYYSYPSITGAASALFLVAFAILLFTRIMVEGRIKILSQSSLIWINSAVLIYYAGNFFFYILYNFILNYSRDFIIRALNFFAILYLLFYILIAIGFWKAGTNQRTYR